MWLPFEAPGNAPKEEVKTGRSDRPHQVRAVEAVMRELDDGRSSTMIVMPTGTGKTHVAMMLCRRFIEQNKRVLAICHRGFLVNQMVKAFRDDGINTAIEMGGQRARSRGFLDAADVVVATVQSMHEDRLDTWDHDYFDLVIVDECHRAAAPQHRRVCNWFHSAPEVGLTATPDGSSGEIGKVYETKAFEYPLLQAVKEGWLVPFERHVCEVNVDLRGIRLNGSDLNLADMGERVSAKIEELADAIKQKVGDRPFVAFTPDLFSAQALAAALSSTTGSGLGIDARYIAGSSGRFGMPRGESSQILKDFAKQKFQGIVTSEMLFEGWDAPHIEAVVIARVTKLRYRFGQMLGRGLRPSERTGKTNCMVVDFDWTTDEVSRDVITSIEFISACDEEFSGMSPEAKSRVNADARKSLDSGETSDPFEALEKAKKAERIREGIPLFLTGKIAKFKCTVVDPLGAAMVMGIKLSKKSDIVGKRGYPVATENQRWVLTKEGITGLDSLTKFGAGKLITEIMKRRKRGLAPVGKVEKLLNYGVIGLVARNAPESLVDSMIEQISQEGSTNAN